VSPAIATTPLSNDKVGESCPVTSGYHIAQTIRLSREELRKQRLHEMADIFMDAFEALEVRA
jgi:hypothetical protein